MRNSPTFIHLRIANAGRGLFSKARVPWVSGKTGSKGSASHTRIGCGQVHGFIRQWNATATGQSFIPVRTDGLQG